LAASSPTLRHTARTIAKRFGPTAEPDSSFNTGSLLGETSLLGFALVCRHSQSEHGSVVIEISSSVPVAQGRHRFLASSIVCLRQRVLSLNPQVAFIFPNGRPFYSLPRFGFYCASMITIRIRTPLTWFAHSAKPHFFFPYRLRHPYDLTALNSFTLSNYVIYSALTHSSNCRSVTDCVRYFVPNRNL
jgi:hypothetical protein